MMNCTLLPCSIPPDTSKQTDGQHVSYLSGYGTHLSFWIDIDMTLTITDLTLWPAPPTRNTSVGSQASTASTTALVL